MLDLWLHLHRIDPAVPRRIDVDFAILGAALIALGLMQL